MSIKFIYNFACLMREFKGSFVIT